MNAPENDERGDDTALQVHMLLRDGQTGNGIGWN